MFIMAAIPSAPLAPYYVPMHKTLNISTGALPIATDELLEESSHLSLWACTSMTWMQFKHMSTSRHLQSFAHIMYTCAHPWLGQIGHRRKLLSLLRQCYVNRSTNMATWTPNVSPISCMAEILEYLHEYLPGSDENAIFGWRNPN